MYEKTNSEIQFIKKNFGDEKVFETYCEDFLTFNNEDHFGCDFRIDLTPYTSDDITTGIVVYAKREKKGLFLCIYVDGAYRYLKVSKDWAKNFLKVQNQLLASPGYWSKEQVMNYEFVNRKPFKLQVVNSIIVSIYPLDFGLYEKALNLYSKMKYDDIMRF